MHGRSDTTEGAGEVRVEQDHDIEPEVGEEEQTVPTQVL